QLTQTTGTAATGTFNLNGGTLQYNPSAANFALVNSINLLADSTIGNIGTAQINLTGTLNGNNHALSYAAPSGTVRLYLNTTATNVSQVNIQSGAMGYDLRAGNQAGGATTVVSNGASLYLSSTNNTLTNNVTLNGGTGQ